jgi:hypothetical protein
LKTERNPITGVSAVLRNLPADPMPAQLGEFVKAMQRLDGFIADPKIKKEAKAVAGLKQIKEGIQKYLALSQIGPAQGQE